MAQKYSVKSCVLVAALVFLARLCSAAGNPILLVGTGSNQFSLYYSEILRAEGLNSFDSADISAVTGTTLNAYDVVILGQVALTSAQVTMLTNWVNSGGSLITMRPDKQLAPLLGLSDTATTLVDAYLLVNSSVPPGAGIVGETVQFHGTADLYRRSGASAAATLYSDANTPTAYPAVTIRTGIGAGGAAAAFTYDLARSVVYTRQGNPAWAGEARIQQGGPIRAVDMFYGAATFDPKPDWVDLNKIAIPQADEQQRLLANLILYMNQSKKPLPRFWYLPFGKMAAVVMTGDDHALGGTAGRFDDFVSKSSPGCVVGNWECVRSTSYLYVGAPLTDAQAASYTAQGFEVALHTTSNCADFTDASIQTAFTSQLSAFLTQYRSVPVPITNRTHCLPWSTWSGLPQAELDHGIRLDANYYYWPPSWMASYPGFFTGSGFPMRLARSDGSVMDVYQATTQMTDESGQAYPGTINVLLDNAVGPSGYYGVFTANMHNDYNNGISQQSADQIVAAAQSRGVPVVSAKQMLQWLDGRNASSFGSFSWSGNTLNFTLTAAAGANGLQAMLPLKIPTGGLSSLTQGGTGVPYSVQTIKGIQYAFFLAVSGAYQATYSSTWPPIITAVAATPGTTTATITWTTDESATSQVDCGTTVNLGTTSSSQVLVTAHSITLSGLTPNTTYYFRVTSALNSNTTSSSPVAPATASFTTIDPNAPFTVWGPSAAPGSTASDSSAVELGMKFRSDVAGVVTGVRFYKAPSNTGTHVGNLWSGSGTLLGTVTFANETASGWQQANFTIPVPIAANTTYIVSYFAPYGQYSDNVSGFASAGVDNAPLHALADGVDGSNGVYRYGSSSGFPTSSWNSSNYWVDLAFFPGDSVPPVVTTFAIPATAASLTVPISSLTATDNIAVTGYLVTESATPPSANAAGWAATAPASYTCSTAGTKTLYAWAKDASGNVSTGKSGVVVITLSDIVPPVVTAFSIPAAATTLIVPISAFTATDNNAVVGYLVTQSATAPSAGDPGWSAVAPTSYTFTTAGTKTVYGWAKDAAGNVSAGVAASVVITIPALEPAGWFAGDMHVHRSCGGSPEAVSSMYGRMSSQNLSFISLLADMGNGEVQNQATDLPRVNGQDDPVSTPGRIVHWDAEWHWDATYTQYPHQALGGHVVGLGLNQASQIWQEYSGAILDWIHQHNGIGGFAHLQYLDGSFPGSLTCCTPVEYPVEVALGNADFISEDVDDSGSGVSMNPDAFMDAYYKLLNSGFRPGFAAGTDYPCNSSRPLGSLLTYAQPAGGQMTYRNWIDAIAKGRTVISRNGHNEFLALTVNGTATPGDEIRLASAGTVTASVQWTSTQSLTGTIELVSNGVVVASNQTSVTPGVPATWNATVSVPKSGWLAARRMGADGHQIHTAAVFVIVNNAPIRASVSDAQYYVQWMDNLLANTSPGGSWNSYFPTQLTAAQGRYQAARAVYQQIAADAAGATPPSITSVTAAPGATTATITWTTDKNSNSRVDYGPTTSLGSTASDANMVTAHSISLSGLAMGTTYYFRVTSVDSVNNSASSPVAPAAASFTTIDNNPPVITMVMAIPGSGGTARITWTTNKPSTSRVDFGTTPSLGTPVSDPSLVTAHSITLTGLATGTTYYYQVSSTDALNNTSSSLLANFIENASVSVWNSPATPALVDSGDGGAVELGMKFRSDGAGVVTGVRFYKAAANTGTHIGNLWSSTGTLLGTVTFANETASGWQQANFATPVSIAANTTYVVSYFAPNGHYSDNNGFFTSTGVDTPPLHALRSGVDGPNGVYRYGSSSGFPNLTYSDTNYWVDLAFSSIATTAPTLTAISPSSGAPGTTVTVTLTGTNFIAGATVSVVNSGVTVSNVSVASATQITATLTIAADATTGAANVTIATSGGISNAMAFTVTQVLPVLISISLTPATVTGGTSSTGTVSLGNAAPAGGAGVTLSSTNPTAAAVPASITVPAGASSATFTVTTSPVSAVSSVVISGTCGSSTQNVTLTVNPPSLASLSLSPTSVIGGAGSSTGTVTLGSAAPAGGIVVTLSSSNTAVATVPASVSIAAGATTATFTISAAVVVAAATPVTISATYNTVTRTAPLTVNPLIPSSVGLSPATVIGGTSSTATVTLNAAAPAGGAIVSLATSTAVATAPPTVTVAGGATKATFAVTTTPQASAATVTVSATYNGTTRNATLTVNPPAVSSITLTPTSVVGGVSSSGTVTLSGAAPAGGVVVTLSSNSAVATVPGSITVSAGATTAGFTATTTPVNSRTVVTLTASFLASSRTASLTVTLPALSAVALNPSTVKGGSVSTGTVTLNGGAGPAGITVTLSSSNTTRATVPASLVVAPGATAATFTVNTAAVGTTTSVTVSGTFNGTTKRATLTLTP